MRRQPVLICSAQARPQRAKAHTSSNAGSSSLKISASDTQIASTLAGILSRLLLHPVDCIKTRLQHMRSNSSVTKPTQALLHFIATERLSGLYRGILGALIGVVPYSMIYMPSYEMAQQKLTQYYGAKELLGMRHVMAGSIAGLCGSFVKVPVDVVKKRLQAGLYPNIMVAISSIAGDGVTSANRTPWAGLLPFYAGWRSSILYDIPYNAVQFTVLENVKRAVRAFRRDKSLVQTDHVIVGALTGMVTSIITEPLDVIKTRMMTQRIRGPPNSGLTMYRGWLHCFSTMVKEEGVMALWKGTLPRLIWVGASSAIWYGTYQAARQSMTTRRKSLQSSQPALDVNTDSHKIN